MMRSLFSGVSGLKVHQTAMDVIGNNIANVNTIGFRSSSTTFTDVFYQTTQNATGANANTGRAGTNALQIGLGSSLAAITKNMTGQGGMERTDNALDCMINGSGFFIVNQGGANYFTKSGNFQVDGSGNLCLSNGAMVMGWQVDPATGLIAKKEVSALRVMSPENMYMEPEATTDAYISGNIDYNDKDLKSENGYPTTMSFYDNVGNSYTAKFSIKYADANNIKSGKYTINLQDIVDSNGDSIFLAKTTTPGTGNAAATTTYAPSGSITFGGVTYQATIKAGATSPSADPKDFEITTTGTAPGLEFNTSNGEFTQVTGTGTGVSDDKHKLVLDFANYGGGGTGGAAATGNPFKNINVDFSSITQYVQKGVASLQPTRGKLSDGGLTGAGLPAGKMSEIKMSQTGEIYGIYDNGTEKLLGQLAVASFANPAGLEAIGDNLFAATQNSGEFDGIGKDPTEGGASIQTGVVEMSNVDLSSEFTHMIIIQRGFQANSRIITTSDTMLEELVNLKR